MYLSYSAILKNHQLNWLGEVPSDDDVEVIVTILPKNKSPQTGAVNQWAWLNTLRAMPKDDSFEQAILNGRQHLKADERDWSVFE